MKTSILCGDKLQIIIIFLSNHDCPFLKKNANARSIINNHKYNKFYTKENKTKKLVILPPNITTTNNLMSRPLILQIVHTAVEVV